MAVIEDCVLRNSIMCCDN